MKINLIDVYSEFDLKKFQISVIDDVIDISLGMHKSSEQFIEL